jgi:hypothetical protein
LTAVAQSTLQPKSAFSRFPRVHMADLGGRNGLTPVLEAKRREALGLHDARGYVASHLSP